MGSRELDLARSIKRGDRRALSRGISLVENYPRLAASLLRPLRFGANAFTVGVTGPPGTGKSTLVDRIIQAYLEKGLRVGVIAVDPTSPITGGALLGDRVRMSDHATDKRVFIRSMASRGWSGGLSRATSQAIQLLDAAGYDLIILETVGIGQSDIEVVRVSHAVVVVLMPGMGDEVQVSKAGLMEVGDIYVVNKSDLEGADSMVVSLLSLARSSKSRALAVLKVSARSGEGVEKLVSLLDGLRSKFESGDTSMRVQGVKGMILETAKAKTLAHLALTADRSVEGLARQVLAGRLSVEEAANKLNG